MPNRVTSSFAMTNGFGTNFVTFTPPTGNPFFRLKNPWSRRSAGWSFSFGCDEDGLVGNKKLRLKRDWEKENGWRGRSYQLTDSDTATNNCNQTVCNYRLTLPATVNRPSRSHQPMQASSYFSNCQVIGQTIF
jgi:hypothetical protein